MLSNLDTRIGGFKDCYLFGIENKSFILDKEEVDKRVNSESELDWWIKDAGWKSILDIKVSSIEDLEFFIKRVRMFGLMKILDDKFGNIIFEKGFDPFYFSFQD